MFPTSARTLSNIPAGSGFAATRATRVRRSRSILADGWFLYDYQLATQPIHDINALAEIIHNGALTMRVEAINGEYS